MNQYIEAKSIKDVNRNLNILITTLNHNITQIKDDVKGFKENTSKAVEKIGDKVEGIGINLAEMNGRSKVQGRLLWSIVGIIGLIIGGAILSMITGNP